MTALTLAPHKVQRPDLDPSRERGLTVPGMLRNLESAPIVEPPTAGKHREGLNQNP